MRAAAVTAPLAHHGEGPCWSDSWGGLRFVDLTRGDLLTLRDGVVDRLATGHDLATFVRPRSVGGYIVGTRSGIALADGAHEAAASVLTLLGTGAARMNDGETTPAGGLLAGSMADDGVSAIASLDLVTGSLETSRVLSDVVCSNGIGFAPDEQSAYYVDTATSRIDVLDYHDGTLVNRRAFVSIDPSLGYPDGLTVDSNGTVWVALWGGSAVHGYAPDGSLAAVIEVDARQVSACTFGGPGLDILYITTSRQGLAEGDDVLAGSLFAVEPGATVRPVVPFAG